MGTGEAFNYSLSVADTIAQMRAGAFPVFVGQSEYAFNGRLHPLRTAVYFTHAAGALDVLTLRHLSFWHIQNLLLATSIVGAGFGAYLCARKFSPQTPWVAWLVAAWYTLCPSLLASAYGMELYMTVTAAPFLILAVSGVTLAQQHPTFRRYAAFAIGLAGVWLTHPPVAAWTSIGCFLIIGGGMLCKKPTLRSLGTLLSAVFLGAALSIWAFISALTLRSDLFPANVASERVNFARAIAESTEKTGWRAFFPVSLGTYELGNFQLGYCGWLLLAFTGFAACKKKNSTLVVVLCAISFFLLLTLPIPWLHQNMWGLMPVTFASLTNIWPMQRGYLIISAFIAMGFMIAWSQMNLDRRLPQNRERRITIFLGIALLGLWTGREAKRLISLGYADQHSFEKTQEMYRSSNLRLSTTSYAFLGLPDNYHEAARDPANELRVISYRGGLHTVVENSTTRRGAVMIAKGSLMLRTGATAPTWELTPKLKLEPHKRYRLSLSFKTPPAAGFLFISGKTLWRQLPLGDPNSQRGFGMRPGQSGYLTLWTNSKETEEVTLSVVLDGAQRPNFARLATYEWEEITPEQMPLQIVQLVPHLSCKVQTPEEGWLETPRMFIEGYTARVDGIDVYPRRGPDGLTLIPLKAGAHVVELFYHPPSVLKIAAWISIIAWAGLGLTLLSHAIAPCASIDFTSAADNFFRRAAHSPPRFGILKLTLAVVALGVVFFGLGRFYLSSQVRANGPIRIKMVLPMDRIGRTEALFSVGRGRGSTIGFIRYLDNDKIKVGVDVWGAELRESEPITVNYQEPIEFTITDPSLYHNPKTVTGRLTQDQREWLSRNSRFWLNGHDVFTSKTSTSSSGSDGNVAIARNPTRSGSYPERSNGIVIATQRVSCEEISLPLPSLETLRAAVGPLQLKVKLPFGETGQSQPLVSLGGICIFVHYLDQAHVRLGVEGDGITPVFTAPIPCDYSKIFEIEVSHPFFFPKANLARMGYSEQQQAALLGRIRVGSGRIWLVFAPLKKPPMISAEQIRFGHNTTLAKYPGSVFSGSFTSTELIPPDDWPLPPGEPERATMPGTFGPLNIKVKLPSGMIGRVQPLLTSGRAGEGAIIMVHYLSATEIRVGIDVWNKALYWSQPITVDFKISHVFTVATSALYPKNSPAASSDEIHVQLDGSTVLQKPGSAYSSTHAQLTVGQTKIGGSFTEPEFLGEIINVERLSAPSK